MSFGNAQYGTFYIPVEFHEFHRNIRFQDQPTIFHIRFDVSRDSIPYAEREKEIIKNRQVFARFQP